MRDHEMNKVLADVAGVEVELEETLYQVYWVIYEQGKIEKPEWTPITDHNQMALVKAGLREQGWGYTCYWERTGLYHEAIIFKSQDQQYHAFDPGELRAFSEAVVKMKGER